MLLSKRSRHGYEIIKELELGVGKKPSASDVYPFLKELMVQGYVKVESTGEREMKKYILTPKGYLLHIVFKYIVFRYIGFR
jgi:DNA-binding PadR family transcriptional regulator